MKITRIEAWSVSMPLTEPYTIAYETIETTTNVFLRIETNRAITGYGCAAPDPEITGETPASVLQTIEAQFIPRLKGADPLRLAWLLENLKSQAGIQPAAMAAIDMALYDILGKVCRLPLWKLLGGFRERMITSVTIGILSEPATIEKAGEWVARGFKALKLKGGLDVEADIIRTIKVREAVGPEIALRFDANQGYTVTEALYFCEQTKQNHVEFIEQPTPKNEPELLGQLKRQTSIPIMADESLLTVKDAFRLVQSNLVDLINIKLQKVGGISEARLIDSVARAAKVPAMIGCMDESALAIAAGLHFALARPNVNYADLDGQIGLRGDPAPGAVNIHQGIIFPTDRPGLGCDLD